MIPFFSRIAITVLLGGTLFAQENTDPNELMERARSAPAEFAADALLRLAGSGKLAADKQREAITEAFQLAAGAQQPLKKRAIPTVRGGGTAGFLDRAFAQDLDAMSLRCRAVRAMLPLDGALALRMFREIPPPALPRVTCEDALVYDLSAYYETLAEVAGKSFTPAEIEEEEPFNLLTGHVRAISAPAQVAPVARMLAGVSLSTPQLEALAATFAGMLKEISGDYRSFAQSVSSQGGAGPAIGALVARCKKMEVPWVPILEAYRAYLVRHFRAARCADGSDTAAVSFGVAASPETQIAGDPARYFNERLREDPVRPLEAEDLVPETVEGEAAGARPCESQDCRRLAGQFRSLLFGPNGLPHSAETMSGGEWQAQVKEYLAALAAWKDDPEGSASSLFRYKCSFYNELSKTVPAAAGRVAVLREYLDFLKQNSFQQESRMEWLLPVNSLIARASLDRRGLAELWHELRGSSDPVIALYAALEEIAPRSPGSRLSIF